VAGEIEKVKEAGDTLADIGDRIHKAVNLGLGALHATEFGEVHQAGEDGDDVERCPVCRMVSWQPGGHKPDCLVRKALEALDEVRQMFEGGC
jgi:hypothetical protein